MSGPLKQAASIDKESAVDDIFFAILASFPVGLFLAVIYNRFLPLQDAWFENYGQLMKQGKVPYRDFYFFTQPLSLLISRAIVEISDKLIYFKYYACVERLILTISLYWLLRQQFSMLASFVGAATAIIGMTSFDADGLFSYFYTAILFLILAIGLLIKAINATQENRTYLLLSGFFLGLGFYSKQSLGIVMGATFFCAFLVISSNLRIVYSRLVSFSAGFSLAGLPFMVWIVCWNLSRSYYEDVFLNAGVQKGGFGTIFTSFFARLLEPADLEAFLVLSVIVCILYSKKLMFFLPYAEMETTRRSARYIQLTAVLFMGAIGFSLFFASVFLLWYAKVEADNAVTLCAPVIFYVLFILTVYLIGNRKLLTSDKGLMSKGMIILVICSLGIMYAAGMSYQIQEQALVPGLGVFLAYVIDFTRLSWSGLMRQLIIFFCALFILFAVTKKYVRTFVWYGWNESMIHGVTHSPIPKLDGFEMDPNEEVIYQRTCEIIEGSCGPGDTVFTFPNCPMFNYLTERPQPTFAAVHYWDVCPDNVAINDANLLKAAPPKVIVWVRAPWSDIDFQERAFRNGHYSGYSYLTSVLRTLTLTHKYQKIDILQLSTKCYPIEVWVRTDDSDAKPAAVFHPSFPLN